MLQRLALGSPSHLLSERFQLTLGQRPIKLEVKFDPLLAEGVCQKMLDV
jgi:hypothetical protein